IRSRLVNKGRVIGCWVVKEWKVIITLVSKTEL
ncbi:hypothetical protein LCGC14_2814670, partial [marine sediment metagenome]